MSALTQSHFEKETDIDEPRAQNAEGEVHVLHAHLHNCLSVKSIDKDFVLL